MSPHPGLGDGATPDSPALGWQAGDGFTPEDARLARVVFELVARQSSGLSCNYPLRSASYLMKMNGIRLRFSQSQATGKGNSLERVNSRDGKGNPH